jgi:hypothetical protein
MPNPPDQTQTLNDILPDSLKTNANGWKSKYGQITRGDLMRLAGFSPIDNYQGNENNRAAWTAIAGLGPYQTAPPHGPGRLSGVLAQCDNQDMLTLARIVGLYNGMSYGTSAYFCCTCV